jgi:hypothetical protein
MNNDSPRHHQRCQGSGPTLRAPLAARVAEELARSAAADQNSRGEYHAASENDFRGG